MKNYIVFLILVLSFSGCQKEEQLVLPENTPVQYSERATFIKGIKQYTMTFEGTVWKYTLDVPLNYSSTKSYPLLFGFKGKKGTPARLAKDMDPYINSRQFIGVYPEPKDPEGWNLGLFHTDPLEDVRFIQALANDLVATGNIKADRIYGMGISNGGSMVHYLALKTNIFAAITPIAGSMYNGITTTNAPDVSVLQIHGMLDRSVPYNGGNAHGFNFYSAPNSVNFWALNNGCNATPVLNTSIPGAKVYNYIGCGPGLETILFSVPDSGHEVFASFKNINLTTYMFDFFDRHTK